MQKTVEESRVTHDGKSELVIVRETVAGDGSIL